VIDDLTKVLAVGDAVEVRQVKHERPGVEYRAEVVFCDERHLIVVATWVQTVDIGYVVFEEGDRSIEHYWTDQWYAIWEVHGRFGLKGWYCNVARPIHVDGLAVTSIDLELDLWVSADSRTIVRLDEDEFEASGLADRDPDAAHHARAALDHLERVAHQGIDKLASIP